MLAKLRDENIRGGVNALMILALSRRAKGVRECGRDIVVRS